MSQKDEIILDKKVFKKIFFICFWLWFLAVFLSHLLFWNMISWKNNFLFQSEIKISTN